MRYTQPTGYPTAHSVMTARRRRASTAGDSRRYPSKEPASEAEDNPDDSAERHEWNSRKSTPMAATAEATWMYLRAVRVECGLATDQEDRRPSPYESWLDGVDSRDGGYVLPGHKLGVAIPRQRRGGKISPQARRETERGGGK